MDLKKRFVILTSGRTGSTLLVDLLRSNPVIDCATELLNEKYWRPHTYPALWLIRAFPVPFLESKAAKSPKSVFGFKLKTGGQVYRLEKTLKDLHQRGWKLIHLLRRDVFQQTLSWCVAESSQHWHSTINKKPDLPSLVLDPALVLQHLRTCVQDRNELVSLIGSLPHLNIVYEDDLFNSGDWERMNERVCRFLDVPQVPLKNRLLKTYERPYNEIIVNYSEILSSVRNSPFANLLIS